jgi:transposase
MNMPNKFVNNLTDENIIKLEQLWQTSSNFRLRNGSQAVLLSFQKVPIDETAKICNVGRDAVSSWIKRWETDGYEGLSDQPKSGRRATLSKKEELHAVNPALRVPHSPVRQLSAIEKKTGKHVSRGMLKRRLKKTSLETSQTRQSQEIRSARVSPRRTRTEIIRRTRQTR